MNRRGFFGRALAAVAAIVVPARAEAFEPNDWVERGDGRRVPIRVHYYQTHPVYGANGETIYVYHRTRFSMSPEDFREYWWAPVPGVTRTRLSFHLEADGRNTVETEELHDFRRSA